MRHRIALFLAAAGLAAAVDAAAGPVVMAEFPIGTHGYTFMGTVAGAGAQQLVQMSGGAGQCTWPAGQYWNFIAWPKSTLIQTANPSDVGCLGTTVPTTGVMKYESKTITTPAAAGTIVAAPLYVITNVSTGVVAGYLSVANPGVAISTYVRQQDLSGGQLAVTNSYSFTYQTNTATLGSGTTWLMATENKLP